MAVPVDPSNMALPQVEVVAAVDLSSMVHPVNLALLTVILFPICNKNS